MVRRNYTEDDVAEAIFDTTDRGLSQNEAAQKRGVPQWTISRRLSGQASRNERIQAHQRIPKSQEETLIRWVLRQESLGYAPSHSQVRAYVEAILQQQGDNKPLGKHWTTRFVKRHPKLSTKIGKRQEAAIFDGFTPKAVNWSFDIRETEYGWIKPENTVNVDEGGIMAGFGLDSLVIGSSDPKKKAMLKGVQSRTWTSFIEAVTATGRMRDSLSLTVTESMHRMSGWLHNGTFNVIKGAYRKELQKLASLTDSASVDKVNFIRAYAKAREAGMRKEIILSGWRFTGNWPINRHKALTHPEIPPDKEKLLEEFKTPSPPQLHSDDTPKTSRQVRDLAKHRSHPTRRKYSKIAKGLEALEMKVAVQNARITGLEEQMAQKAEIEVDVDEKVESVIEVGVRSEDESDDFTVVTKHCQRTRSGREVKKPRRE
ncbi:hypothetical protein QWA68_015429 [Fusarium oxysporum]|nr:hypothetical protein QWA68_015429 [Fusarium oxysporum]